MLQLRVDSQASLGPRISIVTPSFNYTFASGGFVTDPQAYLHAEFAADVPLQLSWSAQPEPGGFIRGFRWAVDIARLDDEAPRSDEALDLRHWSRSGTEPGVVLPAFSPPAGAGSESHYFYLEAEDDLGLRSLCVLQFAVFRPVFDRELLIVDDTWFPPDIRGTGGCVAPPRVLWPNAAELDTFLYAVGDKPYKCYPAGTRSPAGVFAGYAFDTLCTHLTLPSVLNLQRMDRYRNIIWMCDLTSAWTYTANALTTAAPEPLLREWCTPGAPNPLATWLLQGGRLWLMGGGAAMASLIPYDKFRSDNNIFSKELGELGPGRIMYDDAHWQSEVRVLRSIQAARSARAVGGWSGAPDYSALPEILMEKSPATDALPPLRTSGFYLSSYYCEHLRKSNAIVENTDFDPARNHPFSALDTLYESVGGEAGSGWPVMTLYHGREAPTFVFSGFPLWYFQRSQVIDVVDFVLTKVWGLNRRPVPR
jgi:hypothetical protein